MNHSSYVVEYTENVECMSHYTVPEIVHLAERSDQITLQELRQRGQLDLGTAGVIIEFSRDVVQKFVCPECGDEETKFAAMGSLRFEAARCPKDNKLRNVVSLHNYTGEEDFGSRKLNELGLPLLDLYLARHGEREVGYMPYGDAPEVLGVLAPEKAPV
jgi:predicted RNA-binding Zn-ribbon protein involved in translation (DUF1610 family)